MANSSQMVGVLTVVEKLLKATRDAALLLFAFFKIREIFYPREIRRSRAYNSTEAARYLGTDREGIIRLIHKGKLKARKVKDNYQIMGSELTKYLAHRDSSLKKKEPEAENPEQGDTPQNP
ncbi:MAG: helix-turn-helix domain-containing protein [Alphaproteobacteria bacterium]|nr:helix-turn-helix domain-containing protein [Alphaproteobacteria bacterium]MBF0249181.1 helix-turn-helix domain-containing protein [Alphaproteobacteria bacterium]